MNCWAVWNRGSTPAASVPMANGPARLMPRKEELPLRALVVDDSVSVRQLIRRVLESRFGLGVSEASDVGEALDRLHQDGPFELVITDLNLPGLPGGALVRRLKMHEATSPIPVLVLSVELADPHGLRAALENGADAFLSKPFSIDQLAAQLTSLLDGALERDFVDGEEKRRRFCASFSHP